ncbi:MAG: hypothetical protein PHZ00_00580 [Candidatus Peribacteraceae bacterium]|nr:hypothetical protein [Candidatus Peribacteraceae bacterium]
MKRSYRHIYQPEECLEIGVYSIAIQDTSRDVAEEIAHMLRGHRGIGKDLPLRIVFHGERMKDRAIELLTQTGQHIRRPFQPVFYNDETREW